MADWLEGYHDFTVEDGYEIMKKGMKPGSVLLTEQLWKACLEYDRRFVQHVDKKPEKPNGRLG